MTTASFWDNARIASSFDVPRLWNAAGVVGSYWQSRLTGRLTHPSFPLAIAVEPTTSCNLRCPECPSGLRSFTRPTGMLDPALLESLLKEGHRTTPYLTLYFQGEPFLHPGFSELVRIAKKYRMYVAASTNAHYLDEEKANEIVRSGLDRLVISIDGTTQATYEQYRVGGSLEKVLQGTANLVRARKVLASRTPYSIFQFLVVRPNEHQLDEAKELAKSIGIDHTVFKTAQLMEPSADHPLLPTQEKYARYRRMSVGTVVIKNRLDDHCWRMWQSCVVTWDGKVVPCCFDKDASHVMGDLQKNSFA
ncbi:MAG: radical SAM/SPASM domain-containing protein, partial [Flavobacteriales bacterium]